MTPAVFQMLMVYSVPVTVTTYGCVCLVCALMMFLLPIETLGRPLPVSHFFRPQSHSAASDSVRACVRACIRACICACVRV